MESFEQIADTNSEDCEVPATSDESSSVTPVVPFETSSEDLQDADKLIEMFGNEEMGIDVESCCTNECNKKIPKDLAAAQR